MKKFISMLLLITMCIGIFAGCNKPEEEANVDLENAKTYVFNMYNAGASKGEAIKLLKDKEVISSVPVDGVTYSIEWSVEITAGAADSVKIADGKNGNKLVDIPEGSEEQIDFTLTATIKAPNNETASVSFLFFVPKTEKADVSDGQKVTIYNPDSESYVTGKGYVYTSSSGSVKDELVISKNKADAIALTLITNADNTVTFKTADGKFLYADATHAKFVDAEGEYTKFTLEPAEGGSFIKTQGVYGSGETAKPQYLEVYSGYLTVFGMDAKKAAIYTFVLQDAEGANGSVVAPTPDTGDDNTGDDNTGDDADLPTIDAVTPAVGSAYKLAFVQGNKKAVYYLTGVLDGYYMASSATSADGVDFYIEEVSGGYNLYCMVAGAKKYVNMVVSGTHVNGKYEDTATTVYTYDETLKTLVAVVNEENYIFGTKNDGNFTTLGPMKASTNPFYAQFVASTGNNDTPAGGDSTDAPEAGTVKVVIAEYADANSWVDGKSGSAYSEVKLNNDITATVAGTPVGNYGLNTGKYYENGENWRIYQTESATLTIKAAEGKTITSVKITYDIKNTGTLMQGTAVVATDAVVTVNANSITFSVGNTGTATNGNVQITAIEVVYA